MSILIKKVGADMVDMKEHDDIKKEISKFVEKQESKYPYNSIMYGLLTYVAYMSGNVVEHEEQILGIFDTLKAHSLSIFRNKKEK